MSTAPSGTCPKCSQSNPYTQTHCDFCGVKLPWGDAVQGKQPVAATSQQVTPVSQPQTVTQDQLNPLQTWGAIAVFIGGLLAFYFLFMFDTSVPVYGGYRVNNIGLLQDKQNGLIFGIGLLILGGVLLAVGYTQGPKQVTVTVPAQRRGIHKYPGWAVVLLIMAGFVVAFVGYESIARPILEARY